MTKLKDILHKVEVLPTEVEDFYVRMLTFGEAMDMKVDDEDKTAAGRVFHNIRVLGCDENGKRIPEFQEKGFLEAMEGPDVMALSAAMNAALKKKRDRLEKQSDDLSHVDGDDGETDTKAT